MNMRTRKQKFIPVMITQFGVSARVFRSMKIARRELTRDGWEVMEDTATKLMIMKREIMNDGSVAYEESTVIMVEVEGYYEGHN